MNTTTTTAAAATAFFVQCTEHGGTWVDLALGRFATEAEAEAAIADLVKVCGWEDSELRIVERGI